MIDTMVIEEVLTEGFVKHYSVSHATRILSVSRQTMMKWIDEGKFPGAEKSGDGTTDPWLIPAEEVERVRQERVAELESRIEELKEQRRLIESAKIQLDE